VGERWRDCIYLRILNFGIKQRYAEVLYAVARAPSNHHAGRWVCSSTSPETMQMRKASASAKI